MTGARDMAWEPIRGAVFDLDGTLADSRLDFDALRREMGLPPGQPVLEAIERMDGERRLLCRRILHRHERLGVARATEIPGASDFVGRLRRRGVRCAVVTRNSRAAAREMLARLGMTFDAVISREDGPPKPDPWAIHEICGIWNLPVRWVVMIGDFKFDVQCGRRAGCRTVLLTHGRSVEQIGGETADFLLESFGRAEQVDELISWLGL